MTIKQLKEWQFSKSLEDAWWHSQDGSTFASPLTLSAINEALKSSPSSVHKIIHTSQASYENPPWIEIEEDVMPQQSIKRPYFTIIALGVCTLISFLVAGFFLLNVKNTSSSASSILAPTPVIAATPIPTSTPLPADIQTFLREARRVLSALSTGTSYNDYHARLPDLLASTEEALASTENQSLRRSIALFTQSIIDADSMWAYKLATGTKIITLRNRDENGGLDSAYIDRNMREANHLGERWLSDLPELTRLYKLENDEEYDRAMNPKWTAMYTDRTLQKIFKFANLTFRQIETETSNSQKP